MGFEKVASTDKEYAPSLFVRWTEHEDPKANHLVVKKGESIQGYYLKSYNREYNGKPMTNNVIVREDGVHLIIPHAKGIIEAFSRPNIMKGALTRLTYNGKKSFQGKDENGKEVTARSVEALIEQNKDEVKYFVGDSGCEKLTDTPTAAPVVTPSEAITADSVPF